jgi:chromosome segregation ATPase
MTDASNLARNLRDRFSGTTEERLGRALSDLLENPLLTGAIGRAFDAREKASQAQEVALGALNIPSAADIERLTRRLRSVSHRLEGIEDGVLRLDRALSPARAEGSEIDQRLSAIEEQLGTLAEKLSPATAEATATGRANAPGKAGAVGKTKANGRAKATAKTKVAGKAKAARKTKATAKTKAAARRSPGS